MVGIKVSFFSFLKNIVEKITCISILPIKDQCSLFSQKFSICSQQLGVMSLDKSLDRSTLSGTLRPGSMSLVLIAVFTVLGLYFWRGKRRFYHLAAKIPGPPTVPLLGNALDFLAVNNTSKYGYNNNAFWRLLSQILAG